MGIEKKIYIIHSQYVPLENIEDVGNMLDTYADVSYWDKGTRYDESW